MTKNKLIDLNNHLFAELERLGDEDLKGEDLENEVRRARSISSVAGRVIDNAALILKAQVAYKNNKVFGAEVPRMLQSQEALDDDRIQLPQLKNDH